MPPIDPHKPRPSNLPERISLGKLALDVATFDWRIADGSPILGLKAWDPQGGMDSAQGVPGVKFDSVRKQTDGRRGKTAQGFQYWMGTAPATSCANHCSIWTDDVALVVVPAGKLGQKANMVLVAVVQNDSSPWFEEWVRTTTLEA